jgi:hypothetical protein
MITSISPSTSSIISRIFFSHNLSQKIAVPVQPFFSPLISLKHLVGVPSYNNGENIPLYKLRVLDNLIERLARLKNQNVAEDYPKIINSENIDSLITDISRQVKNISKALQPFISGFAQEAGNFLNILV